MNVYRGHLRNLYTNEGYWYIHCILLVAEDFLGAYSIDERTITRVNNKGKPCSESDMSNGHHSSSVVNGQASSSATGKMVSHVSHLPCPDACLPDTGAAQDGLTSPLPLSGTWSTSQDSLAISVAGAR